MQAAAAADDAWSTAVLSAWSTASLGTVGLTLAYQATVTPAVQSASDALLTVEQAWADQGLTADQTLSQAQITQAVAWVDAVAGAPAVRGRGAVHQQLVGVRGRLLVLTDAVTVHTPSSRDGV
jgi:hypothetical protein